MPLRTKAGTALVGGYVLLAGAAALVLAVSYGPFIDLLRP